jgi:hypothetical protein
MWPFKDKHKAYEKEVKELQITAYDLGWDDALKGKDHTDNPFCAPTSRKRSFDHWYAGWVYGKQHGGKQ